MKKYLPLRQLIIILTTLVLSIDGCVELSSFVSSKVLNIYRDPDAEDYQIKRIALIPMANDDTTDTGTFYSTSHFLNLLNDSSFADLKCEIPDVDSLIRSDTALVKNLIESIGKKHKFDFNDSAVVKLRSFLEGGDYDAVIIGKINRWDRGRKYYTDLDKLLRFKFYPALTTSCDFTYFMVSLRDGSIVWVAWTLGAAGNYDFDEYMRDYPPLDEAISNGIDMMINTIPLKKIELVK
jgi:hypothetical protein